MVAFFLLFTVQALKLHAEDSDVTGEWKSIVSEGYRCVPNMPLKVSIPGSSVTSKHLLKAHRDLSQSTEKIATGKRINQAADDAASSGVASNLSAQRTGTRAAMRNIADGVSLLSTMESTAGEIGQKLKRMRELAVQGSSETLVMPERKYLQAEMQSLLDEVDRIAGGSDFNGIKYADGSNSSIEIQMGANNSAYDRMSLSFSDMTVSGIFGATNQPGVKTVAHANSAIDTIDAAINTVGGIRSAFGADQNVLVAANAQTELYSENMAAAESRVLDTEYARESAEIARAQMVLQANMAVRSHAGVIAQAVTQLI